MSTNDFSLELEKENIDPVTLIQVKSVLNENKIVTYHIRKDKTYYFPRW